jgi:hypothetical protein
VDGQFAVKIKEILSISDSGAKSGKEEKKS